VQQKKQFVLNQGLAGSFSNVLARLLKRDKLDTILKIVFLALQLIDLTLTLIAAHSGWPELNPFMRASLSSLYKMAIFKFFVPVFVSWLVPGRLLIPAIILLAAVLGWNVKELLHLALMS
jgi:hypothetical protein